MSETTSRAEATALRAPFLAKRCAPLSDAWAHTGVSGGEGSGWQQPRSPASDVALMGVGVAGPAEGGRVRRLVFV